MYVMNFEYIGVETYMSALLKQSAYIVKTAKIVTMSLVSLTFMSQTAFAQITQSEAKNFTNDLVVELGKIAKDESLNDAAQDRAYRQALKKRLAIESIGKFLFKSVPADLPTPAQKSTYNNLFPNYIAGAFASQIGGLAERQINVTESRPRGEREVIVRSELVNNAGIKKASIDWRIREIDGKPRLLDVLVERVSPLVTKRQEFSSLAKREGIEALLDHMKKVAN